MFGWYHGKHLIQESLLIFSPANSKSSDGILKYSSLSITSSLKSFHLNTSLCFWNYSKIHDYNIEWNVQVRKENITQVFLNFFQISTSYKKKFNIVTKTENLRWKKANTNLTANVVSSIFSVHYNYITTYTTCLHVTETHRCQLSSNLLSSVSLKLEGGDWGR